MQKKSILILFSFITLLSTAQQFQNMDLDAPVAAVSSAPPNWQMIPYTDSTSLASAAQYATPDILTTLGPFPTNGTYGNPYSGKTFVSGLYGYDNAGIVFQEGIMQTVSGFIVGYSYSVNFHQAVVKQDPLNFKDSTGFWMIYIDNVFVGSTSITTSAAPYNDTSFIWEAKSINFTATTTTHTIKFLPMDDDANANYNDWIGGGGVRMGIDSIHLVSNGLSSDIQKGSNSEFSFYPNPSSTELTINYNGSAKTYNIKIYDVQGKLAKQINTLSNNKTSININDLKNGIYLLNVFDGENSSTKRFIKQ